MNIRQRYRNLPGGGIVDKVLYVAMRLAQREFLRRNPPHEPSKEVLRPELMPKNTKIYKELICVTGFGHSGSGAVADLLSEYSSVTVASNPDPNGSLRVRAAEDIEFDVVRGAGGLFAIEGVISKPNVHSQDAVCKMFCALFQRYYSPSSAVYGEHFRCITRKFLDDIIDYKIPSPFGYEFCPQLAGVGKKGFNILYGDEQQIPMFWLKTMDGSCYRRIASEYVKSFLRLIPSEKILVLDQAVSDCTADMDKYSDYFGPLKLIASYRDPRDVYATGISRKEFWIPQDPKVFVKWYMRQINPYLTMRRNDFLLLRFEDLVCDYFATIKKIENFIGLTASDHIRNKKAFDPDVSIKNVGCYKRCSSVNAIEVITNELREYCYEKK